MGMIIVYRHIFLTNIMGWRIDPGLGGSIKYKTSGLEMAARAKIWRGVARGVASKMHHIYSYAGIRFFIITQMCGNQQIFNLVYCICEVDPVQIINRQFSLYRSIIFRFSLFFLERRVSIHISY